MPRNAQIAAGQGSSNVPAPALTGDLYVRNAVDTAVVRHVATLEWCLAQVAMAAAKSFVACAGEAEHSSCCGSGILRPMYTAQIE